MQRVIKPAPIDKSQRKIESQLDSENSLRAIYIDFEGFMNAPPSLVGVSIDGTFAQYVFDQALSAAAEAKNIKVVDGKVFMASLLAKAKDETRKIVAFSQHEKNVCNHFYGLDISDVYADARMIAKKNRNRLVTKEAAQPKTLDDYLALIGQEHGAYFGIKKVTKRIADVQNMLAKKKEYDLLTPVVKAKWTKLLDYNRIDVMGMRELMFYSVGLTQFQTSQHNS